MQIYLLIIEAQSLDPFSRTLRQQRRVKYGIVLVISKISSDS